ncbi:TPA: hypothetical protein DEW47_00105 [Patescibacteria group bacterium]|nr:MAG: Methyltransferase type 11 [Parcubacteria group bacterium GW2011_GWF2_40_10]KKR75408.1 MAG: Methyltransferase type 11 [Parcubacteria group bacterium GW2011_GWB2_40_8]KKR76075.1 MAG: Methyltransferase type 11 [Parcubacteria group bacterium GW2011_GWE2_40_8]HCI04375.1 hypothetical protein [Patescibacteria group bacterium]
MLANKIDFLKCLSCGGNLSISDDVVKCLNCTAIYEKKEKTIFFIRNVAEKDDSIIFRIKDFLKKYPRVFFLFYNTLGVFVGKKPKDIIKNIPKEGTFIVDIASGVKTIREDIVRVDTEPYEGVDIVADALNLPFNDCSCDLIICESSLEHFKDPISAAREMNRVLKKGGLIYISVPFIVGFHASPNDYFRWTEAGVEELMKDFKKRELGVGWGPTYALTSILREWLAIIFSFNSKKIYQVLSLIFMFLFAPFNYLDYIFGKFKSANNIAYGFYYIGEKK